ncbi:hypothetical protein K450DRAFT_261106 [Umbelopsis ramanniana AG]|uniref:Uncharacterized protein n=1 Tax=Umbelopsis ramanniana AG TaxID=1314678 RepID=A0AAD5H8G6_UMBRA|nr:uncharacterized protein K450DRAFT_261106 [Umbelopsis ramanniana AG]KAI8575597.1 hypothetical protein K450DRAFT_261106 [Umbelopsis ramanniana AG]
MRNQSSTRTYQRNFILILFHFNVNQLKKIASRTKICMGMDNPFVSFLFNKVGLFVLYVRYHGSRYHVHRQSGDHNRLYRVDRNLPGFGPHSCCHGHRHHESIHFRLESTCHHRHRSLVDLGNHLYRHQRIALWKLVEEPCI